MNIYYIALLCCILVISGLSNQSHLVDDQAFKFPLSSHLPDNEQKESTAKALSEKLVFKSTDGGQTWQDISKGLPENLWEAGIQRNNFFANDKGLFVKAGNGVYYSKQNATAPFWTRSFFTGEYFSIAPNDPGMFANNYWGVHLKTASGTSVWSPIFHISFEPRIRSIFETAMGAIFIGTDRGLFKTANNGITWKHVYAGGWAGNMAEWNGVLVSTSKRSIIRSTDNGESWALVNSEDNVTWDVKQVKGGFAAVTSSSASNTRMLRISYDNGKTWQPTDAGLQDKDFTDALWRTWNDRPRVQAFQTSIMQVGETFVCANPDGIFKSTDKGKTWKLLLPSVENSVFNLFISGKVIYAVPNKGGC